MASGGGIRTIQTKEKNSSFLNQTEDISNQLDSPSDRLEIIYEQLEVIWPVGCVLELLTVTQNALLGG